MGSLFSRFIASSILLSMSALPIQQACVTVVAFAETISPQTSVIVPVQLATDSSSSSKSSGGFHPFASLAHWIGGVIHTVGSIVQTASTGVHEVVSGVKDLIHGALNVVQGIGSIATGVNALATVAGQVVHCIASTANSIIGGITSAVSFLVTAIGTGVHEIVSEVGDLVNGVVTVGSSILRPIVGNLIVLGAGAVGGAVGFIAGGAVGFVHGFLGLSGDPLSFSLPVQDTPEQNPSSGETTSDLASTSSIKSPVGIARTLSHATASTSTNFSTKFEKVIPPQVSLLG